jgi:hypothetical protein
LFFVQGLVPDLPPGDLALSSEGDFQGRGRQPAAEALRNGKSPRNHPSPSRVPSDVKPIRH